jgi:hypothetical protein
VDIPLQVESKCIYYIKVRDKSSSNNKKIIFKRMIGIKSLTCSSLLGYRREFFWITEQYYGNVYLGPLKRLIPEYLRSPRDARSLVFCVMVRRSFFFSFYGFSVQLWYIKTFLIRQNESEGLFLVDWYVDLTALTSLPFFTTTLEEKNNVYFVIRFHSRFLVEFMLFL